MAAVTDRWLVEIEVDEPAVRAQLVRAVRHGGSLGKIIIAAAVQRPDGIVALLTGPTDLSADVIRAQVEAYLVMRIGVEPTVRVSRGT